MLNPHGQPYSQLQACANLPRKCHEEIVGVSFMSSIAYLTLAERAGRSPVQL